MNDAPLSPNQDADFVQVKNLHKIYQDQQALVDLSFGMRRGEFVALLGPSGCGKSTTLKIIAGLETQTSGAIFIGGNDVSHAPPKARQISMVFQSYALFPHLTVRENIVFGLKARRVDKIEQQKRLKNAVELVALERYLDKKPAQLSGGQCQRVALARSIVSQAPLCLMDEPLSNLDAKLRHEMRSEICALQKKLGLTVLYVTHDQVEAMSMADHIILLNNGKIEQCGTPDALYNAPASVFVGGFIGQPAMNFIHLPEVIVGVRAEHIGSKLSQNMRQIEVRIGRCEYHGAQTLVCAYYQHSPLYFALAGRQTLPLHSQQRIGWDIQSEHYFSTTTQERIQCAPPIF